MINRSSMGGACSVPAHPVTPKQDTVIAVVSASMRKNCLKNGGSSKSNTSDPIRWKNRPAGMSCIAVVLIHSESESRSATGPTGPGGGDTSLFVVSARCLRIDGDPSATPEQLFVDDLREPGQRVTAQRVAAKRRLIDPVDIHRRNTVGGVQVCSTPAVDDVLSSSPVIPMSIPTNRTGPASIAKYGAGWSGSGDGSSLPTVSFAADLVCATDRGDRRHNSRARRATGPRPK